MLGSRHTRGAREDPAVPLVEAILAAAVRAQGDPDPLPLRQEAADTALWICCCITVDESPTWLIYTTEAGTLTWRRVADGIEPANLVVPRRSAGGHADPADVLAWLRDESPTPWGTIGSGYSDDGVLDELRTHIHALLDASS